jgi:hypothetical protein
LAAQNEVKFKVRRLANSLGEFTVKRLASITGLKESSIHSELDRMRRDGYLTVVGRAKKAEGQKGRPAVIYRVVSDPVKRTQLMKDVMAFHVPEDRPAHEEPVGPHYRAATEILERELRRMSEGLPARDGELQLAEQHLSIAEDDESLGQEGTEILEGWFNYARAKLNALAGNVPAALRLMGEAQDAFERNEIEEGNRAVADVAQYVCATQVTQLSAIHQDMAAQRYREALERTQEVAKVFGHLESDDPSMTICSGAFDLLQISCRDNLAWRQSLWNRVTDTVYFRVEFSAGVVMSDLWERIESQRASFSAPPEFFQTVDRPFIDRVFEPNVSVRVPAGGNGVNSSEVPLLFGPWSEPAR